MDKSAESRYVMKQAQLMMFLDYPFGSGHKGTAALSSKYVAEEWLSASSENGGIVLARSSHNTFLTALTEQGIVGALLFSALVLWVLGAALQIMRLRNRIGDAAQPVIAGGFCGGVMVVLLAGIGTDYLMAEVQFWFLAGLVCSIRLLAALASAPVQAPATATGPSVSAPVSGALSGRRM